MILVSTTTCGLSLRNDIPMRANGPIRARETRSEEHTSELQSQSNLVCRLLLEKKKKKHNADSRWHHRVTHLPYRPPRTTCRSRPPVKDRPAARVRSARHLTHSHPPSTRVTAII